jgi:surface antigen
MLLWRSETKACLIGSALLLSMFSFQNDAAANSIRRQSGNQATLGSARTTHSSNVHYSRGRYVGGRHLTYAMAHGRQNYRGWGISCVPYARQVSGMAIPGNAWEWWYNAAGQFARGRQPESGSILAFRANGRMRLGHVAVVSEVVSPREVRIDHANWGGGGVARGVVVVDVSGANDWSAVRVQVGNRGEFGSVYPTYGFIYNRPDSGIVTASAAAPAPMPAINPAPSDLRPVAERPWRTYEEVAQLPRTRQRLDLRVGSAVPAN